jgi:hypothetical protein
MVSCAGQSYADSLALLGRALYDLGGTAYIGKGSGRRLEHQVRRFGLLGEIIARFKSERAAYAYERRQIEQQKPHLNQCAGGGGSRATKVVQRRQQWEIEIERVGTRVYAARGLLCLQGIESFLSPEKIAVLRSVAGSVA